MFGTVPCLTEPRCSCGRTTANATALLQSGREFDIELYEELLRSQPDASRRVVFLTGGAVNTAVSEYLGALPNLHVEKPFSPQELRTIVQQLLAASNSPLADARG
jgi:CheY-like chemotaxis protein